jgi:hypothetical protein
MKYSKVEGYDHFLRDNNTGAIINTDRRFVENYKSKEVVLQVKHLQNEFSDLKNELSEIKSLLTEILKNGT